MSTTRHLIRNYKEPEMQFELARGLGVDKEELDDHFRHGEYADIEIEVDEDMNIVGGEIKEQ